MSGEKKTYSPKNADFAGDTAFAADCANHREETNHLGNVLAVVSDRKIAVEDGGNPGTVEYYEADVVSAQDYYPYGMIMPGMSVSAGEYRYGFGRQEMDNEVSGTGNSYTAEYWQYDSRLGRRWNVDPVDKPHESSYAAFANNPVWYIDPDGADAEPGSSRKRQGEAQFLIQNPGPALEIGVYNTYGTNISSIAGRMSVHSGVDAHHSREGGDR